MEEHGRIAAEQQKKMLALQAMGEFYEEHPQARKEVAAYAEFGRRPFEEVAEAWYALESKGAGLTEIQKKGIMKEALELGRMEPEADLKSIVEMFSLYAKETRQKDINLIQNVLRATMTKAGAELSEVGKLLPRFLPAGLAGGLTGPEAAGLWAYATTRTKDPAEATTGLRNVFLALQGKGIPEAQEMLKGLGISTEQDFFSQLIQLATQKQAGRFGLPEAELLAGKESASMLLSMLTEPEAMMDTIQYVTERARADIDIVRTRLDRIMGTDEVASLEERGRQLDVQIENIKGSDIRALKWNVYLKEYEMYLREAGYPEAAIGGLLGLERLAGATVPWGVEKRFQSIRTEFQAKSPEGEAREIHYHNDMHFNPIVGFDEGKSPQPRSPNTLP